MTTNENEIFTIDFTSYLRVSEKVIGVVSVSIEPATNAPAISEIGYDRFGKHLSMRINATGAGVVKRTYKISAIVSTNLPGNTLNQREVRTELIVC